MVGHAVMSRTRRYAETAYDVLRAVKRRASDLMADPLSGAVRVQTLLDCPHLEGASRCKQWIQTVVGSAELE